MGFVRAGEPLAIWYIVLHILSPLQYTVSFIWFHSELNASHKNQHRASPECNRTYSREHGNSHGKRTSGRSDCSGSHVGINHQVRLGPSRKADPRHQTADIQMVPRHLPETPLWKRERCGHEDHPRRAIVCRASRPQAGPGVPEVPQAEARPAVP